MVISLTGFMGCGKSSVGRELAALLSMPFIDLDSHIEDSEGCKVTDIFRLKGEKEFRRMELAALREILREGNRNLVLALGGGTVTTSECAGLVRERTRCIYLRTRPETLESRLAENSSERPMLAGNGLSERISELMAIREGMYLSAGHYIVDTDGRTPGEIASEIVSLLQAGE